MKFFIPIKPKSQARGRAGINHAGRAMIFTSAKQRRDQNDLIALMAAHRPETPLEGPLRVLISVTMPVPQSWSKRKQAAALSWDHWPTGRPDLDNLEKQALDCMTTLGFWKDDAQVVKISSNKHYGITPGWAIEVEPVK